LWNAAETDTIARQTGGADFGAVADSPFRSRGRRAPPCRPEAWLAAALCLAGQGARAASTAEIREATARVIREFDLQTDLPKMPTPANAWFDVPDWSVWGLIALGVAMLLYCLRDLIPTWRLGGSTGWDASAAAASESGGSARHHPAAADELAAAGNYVEAMHALLLHSLAEIRERGDSRLADSLTSREILRKAALPDAASRALDDIVQRVEWTYFGEHPASAAEYESCRRSFDALRWALAGATA
jgi:hypothetical protein